MRHIVRAILIAPILFVASTALADEVEVIREADREVVRDRTRMDFNDAEIDGELVRPEGGYIPGTSRIRFDSLIELRQDFHDELGTSADSEI